MTRLVEQLQTDAMDASVAVATLLQKVKLAAVKLHLGAVASWVQNELSGYESNVPDYRIINGIARALNPARGWIPIVGDPALIRIISRSPVHQSIPELENLISRSDGSLYLPFSPDTVQRLQKMMNYPFAEYAIFIDKSTLVGISDTVRNAVLDWALELEKAGIMGTDISFSSEEQLKASRTAIHIGNFHGNLNSGDLNGVGARIAQGSTDTSQNTIGAGVPFDQLFQAIERGVEVRRDREALMEVVGQMQRTRGTPGFVAAYQQFISQAATYMTILSPFIPALSTMLGVAVPA